MLTSGKIEGERFGSFADLAAAVRDADLAAAEALRDFPGTCPTCGDRHDPEGVPDAGVCSNCLDDA